MVRTCHKPVVDGVPGGAGLLHERVGEELWDELIAGSLDDEQRRARGAVAGGVLLQDRRHSREVHDPGDVAHVACEDEIGRSRERPLRWVDRLTELH